MIEIKKSREPAQLLHYRQQKGASYEEMDKSVKEELLESLLKEQGHICAYCMKKYQKAENYLQVLLLLQLNTGFREILKIKKILDKD